MSTFTKTERETGTVWLRDDKRVWIVPYPAVHGVRAAFWQAYRAVAEVKGREPWTVDNRRIGTERGFTSLKSAMRAAS